MIRITSLVALFAMSGCIPHLETSGGSGGEWTWAAPENQWPSEAPPEGTTGQGWSEGQTAPDFLLVDQYGDMVSLWQFYNHIVVVDVSTMWCAPCQEIATGTEELAQHYPEELVYVTILHEDVHAEPPDVEDPNTWAETFGITAPILADGVEGDEGNQTSAAVLVGSYPAILVLDRDLTVAERVNSPDHALLEEAVANLLGE